jgi:hypothetical protein
MSGRSAVTCPGSDRPGWPAVFGKLAGTRIDFERLSCRHRIKIGSQVMARNACQALDVDCSFSGDAMPLRDSGGRDAEFSRELLRPSPSGLQVSMQRIHARNLSEAEI